MHLSAVGYTTLPTAGPAVSGPLDLKGPAVRVPNNVLELGLPP